MHTRAFDWGKFLIDLHTGKLFGETGRALVTAVSLGMIFLTVSGVFVWALPKWRKARAAKQAMQAPQPAPAPARAPALVA
jgi:uncharacterized iron-regulated membrane protein